MDNPLAQDASKIEQANLTFKKKRDIEDVFDQFNVSNKVFVNFIFQTLSYGIV